MFAPDKTETYSAPFTHTLESDVTVVGGGPGGLGAAIAAARMGASVILVEQYGALGGMGAIGLVGPFMTSFSADGQLQVIRGIFDELVRRMVSLGGAIHPAYVAAGTSHSSFIVHGHSHYGSVTGSTPAGVPVYNVAYPLLQRQSPPANYKLLDL